VAGLLQSLGIYGLGLVVYAAVTAAGPRYHTHRDTVAFQFTFVLAVVASFALGLRHAARGRSYSACGVFLGTVLWLAIGFAIVAWAVASALSRARIPW
jgi:hypothetical protein